MTNTTTGARLDELLDRPHPGQVALACASLGWRVLPLDRRSKKPVLRAWPERATTDVDVINEWWSATGGAFASCITGVATGRGTNAWVLDVDQHGGDDSPNGFDTLRELEARYEPLPETFTVRTPSGGEHRWFEYPADVEVVTKPNTLGPGLDTRGYGGQVVAPGVWAAAGRYQIVRDGLIATPPDWLVTLVTRRVGDATDWDGWSDDASPGSVDDWLAQATTLGDGDQEWFLFRFMSSLRARAVAPSEMHRLGWEAARRFTIFDDHEPWTPINVAEKVTSACRYAPGASTATRPTVIPEVDHVTDDLGTTPVVTVPLTATDRELPSTGTGPDNPHRNTDRANGIEVARFLDGRALWTPEAGWHIFDGRRWASDGERVHTLLIGEFTDRLRRDATSGTRESREAEVLMERANRVESASGLRGALAFAEPLLAHPITRFDVDPWSLNCPNGTLDLRTGELRAHDSRDLLTRVCPTPYESDARDEVWERVVREALDGDVDRMRVLARFAGYTLTGRTNAKRMLVINGPTNTGKSTMTNPLLRTLGDVADGGYATTWDAEVVQADSRVNRGEKLAKVRGARMVLVGELEKGSRMADGFVKQFTGGDTMDAKALYKGSYSYQPSAKLWMATNYVPQSPDKALQERLLLLPFRHEPTTKDPAVKARLDDDLGARRAILAWAVHAALAWYEHKTFGDTPWLAAEKDDFALASDPILQFIRDELRTVETYDESAHVDDVWQRYSVLWAVDNVRNPLKRRTFDRALEEHGLARKRGTGNKGPMRWRGYRVRHPGEDD